MKTKNFIQTVILLPVLLLSVSLQARTEDPFLYVPGKGFAGYSSSVMPQNANPALAADSLSPLFAYRYWKPDFNKAEGNHSFAVNIWGMALTWSYVSSAEVKEPEESSFDYEGKRTNINMLNISKGFFFGKYLGLGAGFSFGKSRNALFDRYRTISAGFVLRPAGWISIGGTVSGLAGNLGGNKLQRQEELSLSLRPFGDSITLSGNFYGNEDTKFLKWEKTASVELGAGLSSLYLRYSTDSDLSFGIKLSFEAGSSSPGILTAGAGYYCGKSDQFGGSYFDFSYTRGTSENGIKFGDTGKYVRLVISEPPSETGRKNYFSSDRPGFSDIIFGLELAASDPSVSGVILEIKSSMGFAQAQELRDSIKKLKKENKKVYAFMAVSGNIPYYTASAATEIYMVPNSTFGLNGLSAKVYFFKELMAKLGIHFDVFRQGKYKSVFESFTGTALSEPVRENLMSVLEDASDQFLNDIMNDRKLSTEDMNSLFAAGTLTPSDAVNRRFIDGTCYFDEFMEDKELTGKALLLEDYISVRHLDGSWKTKPSICIIHVDGNIVDNAPFNAGRGMTDTGTYIRMLTKAFKDSSIKAVIIRISSGGGSALASDYMQHELKRLQEKYPKPVVFSFGNTAASGGYYIACADGEILCQPGTLTGSIGVITGKLTLKQLYEKIGISVETLKTEQMADISSEARELTPEERDVFQKDVDFIYSRFTGLVEEYRKIPAEQIPSVAEGRIFSGRQAKAAGLADRLGGLAAAVELAAAKAGIKEYTITELPVRKGSPVRDLVMSGYLSELRQLLSLMDPVLQAAGTADLMKEGNALMMCPYTIEIQ